MTDIEEQKVSNTQRPSWGTRLSNELRNLDWRQTALVAAGMALIWCLVMYTGSSLQLLAGVVPLFGGMYLGWRVKERLLTHGLVLGILGFFFGLGLTGLYAAVVSAGRLSLPPGLGLRTPGELLIFYLGLSPLAMIPFPAFGTITAGRNEQRSREMRKQIDERGGQLERYSRVADLSDLQGLSLPQFGRYVVDLFKRKGFTFKDYQFIDKDKHLDLQFEYEGEQWLLRLTVSDKVRPGTVESLAQEMRQRQVAKGLVITSTEFTAEAQKSAKGKRHLLLIDGQTLLGMSEG